MEALGQDLACDSTEKSDHAYVTGVHASGGGEEKDHENQDEKSQSQQTEKRTAFGFDHFVFVTKCPHIASAAIVAAKARAGRWLLRCRFGRGLRQHFHIRADGRSVWRAGVRKRKCAQGAF